MFIEGADRWWIRQQKDKVALLLFGKGLKLNLKSISFLLMKNPELGMDTKIFVKETCQWLNILTSLGMCLEDNIPYPLVSLGKGFYLRRE